MRNDTDLAPVLTSEPGLGDGLDGEEALAPVSGDYSLRAKVIALIVAVAIMLISVFPLAEWASSPATHAGSIAKLDAKAQTVTALVGSSTAAAVAITLLPDDVGTPVADKLVDVAADFAIVLAAIYLEKYLLTIGGLAAFWVILPLACVVAWLGMAFGRANGTREKLYSVALRLALLALAAAFVVPASVSVSTLIEDTYHYDASSVAESLDQEAQQTEEQSAGNASADSTSSQDQGAESADSSSSGNWFSDFIDWAGGVGQTVADAAASAAEGITSGVTGVLDSAKAWVAELVEAFAVMIVTCCVIPILVLLFFVWLINVLLGLNIQIPTAAVGGMKGRLRPSSRSKAVRKA